MTLFIALIKDVFTSGTTLHIKGNYGLPDVFFFLTAGFFLNTHSLQDCQSLYYDYFLFNTINNCCISCLKCIHTAYNICVTNILCNMGNISFEPPSIIRFLHDFRWKTWTKNKREPNTLLGLINLTLYINAFTGKKTGQNYINF